MRTFPVIKATSRKISATVSSPDDISGATPTIALHDDTGAADTFLAATWTTTPVLGSDGYYRGVAQTTSNVDFSTKALGTYIVRGKAGTTVVNCYIIKVVP